jgi:hypothetical protein
MRTTATILVVVALFLGACQTAASATRAPVAGIEIFIKGSDIDTAENEATHALRDKVETLVQSRRDMSLSAPGRGDIVVLIPNLVTIDTLQNVYFAARLTRKRDGATHDVSGSCPRAALSKCAQTITDALATMEE